MNKIVVFLFLMLYTTIAGNAHALQNQELLPGDTTFSISSLPDTVFVSADDAIQQKAVPIDKSLKKKLISAMLAFPFPFGFMGAHRVMLGCKPWVPVVYVATFGGCFGILPLIDFFSIVFTKDISQYENNSHVFMWMK
jgi:TM2 domain-containing membrane protein YozV